MAKTKKSFDYGDPFPSRFRNLIEKKGATLDALATEFNTTRQTVSNWQMVLRFRMLSVFVTLHDTSGLRPIICWD